MDDNLWYGLLILNAAALIVTAVLVLRTRHFLARASRAQGTIARVSMSEVEMQSYGSDHPASTARSYTPHVEFQLEDGSNVEFESRVSHPSQPLYRRGEAVPVVYDRRNPAATAEIAGAAVWRSAIFSSIGAFLLLCATLLMKACS